MALHVKDCFLILSFALIATTRAGAGNCKPLREDLKEFGMAFRGYDPFKADEMAPSGNPGFMKDQIFHYDCATGYRADFVTITSDLNCQTSMTSKSYTTAKEYSKAMSSSGDSSLDVSFDAEGTGFGFSAGASFKYASTRNSESSQAMKSLKTGKGEVIVSKATCFTYDMSISTFARKKFTIGFINGLKHILASLNGSERDQENIYKAFTEAHGTHFVEKTELGASLTTEKVYQSRSSSAEARETKLKCMSTSVEACLKAGYEGGVISAEAKACVNKAMSSCQSQENSSKEDIEDSDASVFGISRGSRPTDLKTWSTSNFKPIPIQIHYKPLSQLINTHNLAKSAEYGIDVDLDVTKLRAFFDKYNMKYCINILGLTQEQCIKTFTGCGEAGACKYGETCVNDHNSADGYRCVHRGKYCHNKDFQAGRPWGSGVKYANMTVADCAADCASGGGQFVSIPKWVTDTATYRGDCYCHKTKDYVVASQDLWKHAAVGACSDCHGAISKGYFIGDRSSSTFKEQEVIPFSTLKSCTHACLMRGASYITFYDNGVPLDQFYGRCNCEFGITRGVGTAPGWSTTPLLADCLPPKDRCQGDFVPGYYIPDPEKGGRFESLPGRVTLKQCSTTCIMKGAIAITLEAAGDLDKYQGSCWCGFGPMKGMGVDATKRTAFLKKSSNDCYQLPTCQGGMWGKVFCPSANTCRLYCYKEYAYHQVRDFAAAATFCREQHNGVLAMPKTKEEWGFVNGYLAARYPPYGLEAWLGISDQAHEGKFVYQDGSPLVQGVVDWAPGQPDSTGGNEDCLSVRITSTWDNVLLMLNDESCATKRPFICQARTDIV